uniref:Uncharacterized protein n=1 Tax=Timema douglasi TaxID=61478 RepID=A0A7R8VCY9_TIMDO|nr:unnamed protein product [Timema douglasi]
MAPMWVQQEENQTAPYARSGMLTLEQRFFDYLRLSRARRIVEKAFEVVYPHLRGEIVENQFVKNYLSTPDRNLNLYLSVIGSLVYCVSSVLDHAVTQESRVSQEQGDPSVRHRGIITSGSSACAGGVGSDSDSIGRCGFPVLRPRQCQRPLRGMTLLDALVVSVTRDLGRAQDGIMGVTMQEPESTRKGGIPSNTSQGYCLFAMGSSFLENTINSSDPSTLYKRTGTELPDRALDNYGGALNLVFCLTTSPFLLSVNLDNQYALSSASFGSQNVLLSPKGKGGSRGPASCFQEHRSILAIVSLQFTFHKFLEGGRRPLHKHWEMVSSTAYHWTGTWEFVDHEYDTHLFPGTPSKSPHGIGNLMTGTGISSMIRSQKSTNSFSMYATGTVCIHTHKQLIYDLPLSPWNSRDQCQNQQTEREQKACRSTVWMCRAESHCRDWGMIQKRALQGSTSRVFRVGNMPQVSRFSDSARRSTDISVLRRNCLETNKKTFTRKEWICSRLAAAFSSLVRRARGPQCACAGRVLRNNHVNEIRGTLPSNNDIPLRPVVMKRQYLSKFQGFVTITILPLLEGCEKSNGRPTLTENVALLISRRKIKEKPSVADIHDSLTKIIKKEMGKGDQGWSTWIRYRAVLAEGVQNWPKISKSGELQQTYRKIDDLIIMILVYLSKRVAHAVSVVGRLPGEQDLQKFYISFTSQTDVGIDNICQKQQLQTKRIKA